MPIEEGPVTCHPYSECIRRCIGLVGKAGLDVLLLAKPANRAYLTGDERLCAYAMITREGKVPLEVPSTDVEDVKFLNPNSRSGGDAQEIAVQRRTGNERSLHG